MLSLKDLTSGEKLLVYRKRNGLSQVQAAKRHKVTLFQWRQWEVYDEAGGPRISLGSVLPHEMCIVHRRRSSIPVAQLAKQLECCKWWLRQMEAGLVPNAKLLNYWGLA